MGDTLRLPAPSLVVLDGPADAGTPTWASRRFDATSIVPADDLRVVGPVEEQIDRSRPPAETGVHEAVGVVHLDATPDLVEAFAPVVAAFSS